MIPVHKRDDDTSEDSLKSHDERVTCQSGNREGPGFSSQV